MCHERFGLLYHREPPLHAASPVPGIGLVGLGAPGRGSTADASGDEFDF